MYETNDLAEECPQSVTMLCCLPCIPCGGASSYLRELFQGMLRYNADGYDANGYDRRGYDKHGYDRQGYNRKGYDRHGYNRKGYTRHGYDRHGYNRKGYTRQGYDIYGYDVNGYNKHGYDRRGYDIFGYNEDGYNVHGCDKYGYHKNGFNREGYDREGYNKDGYDKNGIHKDGYSVDGYDVHGYSKSGYDKQGYNREGYNKWGYSIRGHSKHTYSRYKSEDSPEDDASGIPAQINTDVSTLEAITKLTRKVPVCKWIPFESLSNLQFEARGGFGSIYSSVEESGCKVALKCLEGNVEFNSAILAEAMYHFEIYSPFIVPVYGITQHPETQKLLMVMKWCDGKNLRCNLVRSCTYITVYHIVWRILYGLNQIHAAGLYHGDLHTGNILLGSDLENAEAFVADLGSSRLINSIISTPEAGSSSQHCQIVGVLPYMAPEVLSGKKYTKESDVYSFGIILWVLLTRHQPFSHLSWDDISLQYDICEGIRPPIPAWTPAWLQEVMMRCWDANQAERPTASELCEVFMLMWDIAKNNKDLCPQWIPETPPTPLPDHPSAIYHSHIYSCSSELPTPRNAVFGQKFLTSSQT